MNEPTVILAHIGHVSRVLFAPDSRSLLSAGMDNLVKAWSVPSWELLRTYAGHERSVNALALSADGAKILL